MPRVAGTDPGTSGLDLVVLEDGGIGAQARFSPDELQQDPHAPIRWLEDRGPFNLVAGPSGYGLPLVSARDCTSDDLRLMTLAAPQGQGVRKFSALVRAFCESSLPVVFLPGVIHLPTVPAYRKINRIDLGTADKLCVAALALALRSDGARSSFCLIELGSVFTALIVVHDGVVVDGLGGTSGPPGWGSGGAWDGEVALYLAPLSKRHLFEGGRQFWRGTDDAATLFREAIVKSVAALQAVSPFAEIILSGKLLDDQPDVFGELQTELARFGGVKRLPSLPGAWVKHAAQGSAVIADGLAGGRHASVVEQLHIREATGTVLDGVRYSEAR